MAKRHFKTIKMTEFDAIKTMLNAGLPVALVAKATKRSWIVISVISKSPTLEAYHNGMRAYTEGKKPKQVNKTQESVGESNEKHPRIIALLETIVKQQVAHGQDLDKIKKRLLISG